MIRTFTTSSKDEMIAIQKSYFPDSPFNSLQSKQASLFYIPDRAALSIMPKSKNLEILL